MAICDFEASIENVFRGIRGGSVSLDDAERRLKEEIGNYRLILFDCVSLWLQSKRTLDGFEPERGVEWGTNAYAAANQAAEWAKGEARHRFGVALLGQHYKPSE